MRQGVKRVADYTILRRVGSGGFGCVYLALRDGEHQYVALKLIDKKFAGRELIALEKYALLADKTHLVPIWGLGQTEDSVYYVMPLADPLESSLIFSPEDFRWQEKSLQRMIEQRRNIPSEPWFSQKEILSIIEPVFDAVIALSKSGFLHRDIKPENILFFDGEAKLSDVGLLEQDRRSLTNIGTPLFCAPSWFVNKGGSPDVYGLATTFFSLITGYLPDTIGRPAYRFPEKAGSSFTDAEREQWLHWHRCILRAIAEEPEERYVSVEDFKNAIFSTDFDSSRIHEKRPAPAIQETNTQRKTSVLIAGGVLFSVLATSGMLVFMLPKEVTQDDVPENQESVQPSNARSSQTISSTPTQRIPDTYSQRITQSNIYNRDEVGRRLARERNIDPTAEITHRETSLEKPFFLDFGNNIRLEFMPIVRGSFRGDNFGWSLADFSISRTEVTQAQFEAIMGYNPSHFKGPDLPVENISRGEAIAFCQKLTEREHRAGRALDYLFRLPLQSQWEYACRAGSTGAYCFGSEVSSLKDYANFCEKPENPEAGPKPVASYKPNAWGLYDMHGNVWEWLANDDIVCGGAWDCPAESCRASNRGKISPREKHRTLGFRVAVWRK